MSFFFDGCFGDPLDPTAQVPGSEDGTTADDQQGFAEQGFGDKEEPAIQSPVLVGAVNGHALYHDEGGEIVRVNQYLISAKMQRG